MHSTTESKFMLRLGLISYLNTFPVYYAIEEGLIKLCDVQTVKAVPTVLNRMLAEGELDISVVSSFEYALHHENYLVLPKLCIGADGPVKSVLFFSKAPLEDLNKKEVFLTKTSLTSKYLMLWLFKKLGIQPRIHEFSFENGLPEGGYYGILLIGDEALRMKKKNIFPYVYDLSELWKCFFNLPFVFALWCVRKEAFEAQKEKVLNLWKTLLQSKEMGKKNLEAIALKKSKELGINYQECVDYLKALHFDLEAPFISGLKKFFKEMSEAGFLNEEPKLKFVKD